MSSPMNPVAAGDPTVACSVEFRAYDDDAWYSVRVLLESEGVIRIKYLHFPDDQDNVFEVKSFTGLNQLEEFKGRFRSASEQLQDTECRKIVEGMTVCACHCFSPDDVRFYDAVINEVQENEHYMEKGEEVCLCTFTLFWLHGPIAGSLTNSSIENICKIQHTLELDPLVTSFLKIARERIEANFSNSCSISNGVTRLESVAHHDESSNSGCRLGFLERLCKETRYAKRSASKISPSEDRIVTCHDKRLEDTDLERINNQCMILIGNLDKALSPPTIAEFLHRQTSILPRVYIYPSLSSELYTRGAIVLNCEKDFQKLCDFLNNPNHIVISSTGRPWVIIEKLVGLKNIKASIGTLMPISKNILQKGCRGKSNDLKVACSGTPEFRIASGLRDLFNEFYAHQQRLHERLAFEEGKILFS